MVSADPAKVAKELAEQKALECDHQEALVIGMDTLVVIGKSKLAKPADAREARDMLRRLSGRMHRVISGVAVRYQGKISSSFEETKVYFKRMTEEEISWYIATGEPFDKAGGYAIQGQGRIFIKRIDGCYYNVVGFPLFCFQRLLGRFGLTILDLQQARQKLSR
jgi:septum formation protein